MDSFFVFIAQFEGRGVRPLGTRVMALVSDSSSKFQIGWLAEKIKPSGSATQAGLLPETHFRENLSWEYFLCGSVTASSTRCCWKVCTRGTPFFGLKNIAWEHAEFLGYISIIW
jgi:hypothetical protein